MEYVRAFQNAPFDFAALTNFSALSQKSQKHLLEVYKALTWALAVAAVGVCVQSKIQIGAGLSFILAFGALMWLSFTPFDPYDQGKQQKRFLLFTAFGFFKGCTIAPLVYLALTVDPSLVATAFFSCAVVFACFSVAALNAKRRSMLFLAGALSSAISTMMVLSLVNIFFRSPVVSFVHLYGGLLVFVGYVMYDTQLIIEKSISEIHPDSLSHALQLFIDFVAIFVRILIILLQQQAEKEKKRNQESKK
jgi:FtsH-binding integral membrane protein